PQGTRSDVVSVAPSVDVRSVVDGGLAVRLPTHEHEPCRGLRIRDGELATRSKDGDLRAACPAAVGAEARLTLEQVDEAIEAGVDRDRHGPALRQVDVQDDARSAERDRRALADQRPDEGIAVLPERKLSALHDLRRGL